MRTKMPKHVKSRKRVSNARKNLKAMGRTFANIRDKMAFLREMAVRGGRR